MAKKGKEKTLRKLIFNDKYLIITALVLAVIVWIAASLNIGTNETKTVKINVPIEISDDLSQQLGMKYYSLQKNIELDVTISGAKYVIGQVNDKDLNVKFDTSNVNRAGEQSIPILVTNKSSSKDFTVTSVYPSSIDAYFDVEETKNFDISLVYDHTNTADGYVFGVPAMSSDSVIARGPKTYVDLIDRVVAEVDFGKKNDLKEPFTQECNLSLKGTGVESNYITLLSPDDNKETLDKISVTIPVLKETTLPLGVNFENAPANLIDEAMNVSYSMDEIKVGILESTDVSKAVLGTIDYSDIKLGKNTFTFNTNDIQGVYVIDDSDKEVKVTVDISDEYYEKINVPVKTSDVVISGAPNGKNAKVNSLDDSTVSVIVPKGTNLTSADLSLKVNVSEENEDGVYPVDIKVGDSSSWVTGKYNANVTIK